MFMNVASRRGSVCYDVQRYARARWQEALFEGVMIAEGSSRCCPRIHAEATLDHLTSHDQGRHILSLPNVKKRLPSSHPHHRSSHPPTLLRGRNRPRIDAQLRMSHHLLNLAFLLQIIQRLPGQGSVDLQSIDQGGNGDETVGLDVLVEFVRGGFVEDDGVVGFVLDCLWVMTVRISQRCCCTGEDGKGGGMEEEEDGQVEGGGGRDSPFPLDHFFFCFLPAEAAAGACGFCQPGFSRSLPVRNEPWSEEWYTMMTCGMRRDCGVVDVAGN